MLNINPSNENSEDYYEAYDNTKLGRGILRRKWLVAFSTLLFFLLGSYLTFSFLTTYKAEAVVVFQEQKDLKDAASGITVVDFSLPTALDIIKLPTNIEAVKSILSLNMSTSALASLYEIPTPRSESNLIRIIAHNANPALAISLANTLADVAVKNSQKYTEKQLQLNLQNYQGELETTRNRLSVQLNELEEFKKKFQYFEMTPNNVTLLKEISEAKKNLQDAETNFNTLLVEYQNLKRESANLPLSTRTASYTFIARINALESALVEAKTKYSTENPKLKALESEIEQLKSRKNAPSKDEENVGSPDFGKDNLEIELIRMQGRVRAAQKTKQDMSERLIDLQKALVDLPALQVSFTKLLQAKELTIDQEKFLTKAIEDTKLMLNIPRGSLEFYQKALDAKPSRDSILVYFLPFVGALFGLFAGAAAALLLEVREDKIRTAKQLTNTFGLPCWQVIPELPNLLPGTSAERLKFFIRRIDERLENVQGEVAPSKIALVGSQDDEGKTVLAYNIARYAADRGKKTAFLCMESKSPQELPQYTKAGVEKFLKGEAGLDEVTDNIGMAFLKIVREETAMKELIRSPRMAELWKELEMKYEFIVVDTPGIIAEDYSINLAKQCNIVLFVIDSSHTPQQLIEESLQSLSKNGITPTGVILNRAMPIYIEDETILRQLQPRGKNASNT
ncbi:MAG: hypothetical protein WC222_07835 [Parachlamydiales bacterium]|jgi:Mrp family chromosome partitioning ATPase/uncharacterized protein involved in exopolysaccharide biosynthesis